MVYIVYLQGVAITVRLWQCRKAFNNGGRRE